MEGVPNQKVMLTEEDVAKGAVYDSSSAYKKGDQSAGHALMRDDSEGACSMTLFVQDGGS